MKLRRLDLSLLAVQAIGLATLVRSIAFDRWITVLAAGLLLVGATAGRSGKSWGVALAFGSAAWFPVAALIGIAPPWFALVGLIGALPFFLASRAFARFDKGAFAMLTAAGLGVGAVGATLWREYAWSVFTEVPSLRPSLYAQHGLLLLPVIAVAVYAMGFARRKAKRALVTPEEEARYRVAEQSGVRVADLPSAEHEAMEELESELDVERPLARRVSR